MKLILRAATCLLLALCLPALARAQTAFTYQGLIKASGSPASGPVDLRFRLYDAASAGAQVGPQIALSGVALDAGVFTTTLDFGVAAYAPNAPRWLEIDAATAGGSFVTLAPRQPLTAAPMALNMRGIVVDATNRVGIGNPTPPTPSYALDVLGSFRAGNLELSAAGNTVAPDVRGAASIWQSFTSLHTGSLATVTLRGRNASAWAGTLSIYAGEGTGGTLLAGPIAIGGDASATNVTFTTNIPAGAQLVAGQKYTIAVTTPALYNHAISSANPYSGGVSSVGASIDIYFTATLNVTGLIVTPSGRVGIGTPSPTDALDVRGNIRLGPAGELHAPGAEERLRIVRGTVGSSASIQAGSGFNVSSPQFGTYFIAFDPPFADTPTITASATSTGIMRINSATASLAIVEFVSLGGQSFASGFHFVATGPR